MKQVISGKLADTPELRTVKKNDGTKEYVTNFVIFAYDPNAPEVEKNGKNFRKGIPLKCTAWGDNAVYMSKQDKGSIITASSTMRLNEYSYTDEKSNKMVQKSEPIYVIRRIDPDNAIQKQMSNLLSGYEEGKYDQLFENEIEAPAFGKDRNQKEVTDKAVEKGEKESKETAADKE